MEGRGERWEDEGEEMVTGSGGTDGDSSVDGAFVGKVEWEEEEWEGEGEEGGCDGDLRGLQLKVEAGG